VTSRFLIEGGSKSTHLTTALAGPVLTEEFVNKFYEALVALLGFNKSDRAVVAYCDGMVGEKNDIPTKMFSFPNHLVDKLMRLFDAKVGKPEFSGHVPGKREYHVTRYVCEDGTVFALVYFEIKLTGPNGSIHHCQLDHS